MDRSLILQNSPSLPKNGDFNITQLVQNSHKQMARSDNGPQFNSAEFAQFAKEWGFHHNTTSPKFPQTNGEVERAVKTVKSTLKKEKDPAKALLAYKSTPLACGFPPAILLMGRRLQTSIPTFNTNLTPKWPDMEKLKVRKG